MRSLRMQGPSHGPDRTAVDDLPVPRPGPGQVTIDVAHAGLNFLDVMARRGDPGYVPAWPYAPGLEVSGRVREVGSAVSGLEPGRPVAAFTRGGGLAEVAVADAALAVPVPDGVPGELAAAAPLMLTSAYLLLTSVTRLGPGETVLMHAVGGGVGSAVAQLVPLLGGGLRIGTVGRPEKVPAALAAGWDVVLPRAAVTPEEVLATAGTGVDVVLDPLGTDMIGFDLDVAGPGARVALFGNPGGGTPQPLPPLGRLIGGNVALAGFSMSRLTAAAPDRAAAGLRQVLALLADGKLTMDVTVLDGLAEVPALLQLLAEGRGTGKYVVAVG
ncbi:MAG TPA: zinc-binding dehydrogenase [Pseudonocardia sp.]